MPTRRAWRYLPFVTATALVFAGCGGSSNGGTTTTGGSGTAGIGGSPSGGASGSSSGSGSTSGASSSTSASSGGASGGSTGSGGGSTGGDAGITCPQPAGSCTPCPGAPGNSIYVGKYCTQGGGQCPLFQAACAADEPGGAGQDYCVVIGCPTFSDGGYNCGANACCYGEAGNPIHACVPFECATVDGVTCPPPP